MNISSITTAKRTMKCARCADPIVKNEGVAEAYGIYVPKTYRVKRGYLCYKCSGESIRNAITNWKRTLSELEKANHHSKQRLKELKLVRMI